MRVEGGPSMHNMLINLMKQPDPQLMLRSSRPFDRSQETLSVSNTGQVVKYYWQGALPPKVRDVSLNLAYDVQMSKLKRNMQTSGSSRRSSVSDFPKKSRELRQLQSSFYRDNTENINSYNSNNHSFELGPLSSFQSPKQFSTSTKWRPQEMTQSMIEKVQEQPHNQRQSLSVKRERRKLDVITDANAYSNNNNNNTNNHSEERKSFSIKYIGVHKDIIGVLSRKIPLEHSQEPRMRKSSRDSLTNSNSPLKSKTVVEFFKHHPRKDEAIENNINSNDQNATHENNQPDVALKIISEEDNTTLPPTNNLDIDSRQIIEQLLTPRRRMFQQRQTTYQRFYGEPIQKQLSTSRQEEASTTFISDTQQQHQQQNIPLSRPQTSTPNQQLPSMASTRNHVSSTTPGRTRPPPQLSVPQTEEKIVQYEVPDPAKYDKYLVNRYSIQRKLVALKKSKEDSPCFQKKQLFTFLNNI